MEQRRSIYRLNKVSKVFDSQDLKVAAIDDLSLEIYEGEIFGIIGMSGAGKSTLVRTLNRLEDVTAGQVYFEDRELGSLSGRELREVRQSVGMIFQGFNLLTQKTVLQNVMAPLKIKGIDRKKSKEKALETLEIVGLTDKAASYPSQLSGGQKQRVAIARALAMSPKVLLCDEATSALDPMITDEILNLLQDINKKLGLTIVLITHEMDVVEKICDRVAIINKGRIAELGDVKDIFSNPQSEAAKNLILPAKEELNPFDMTDRRCIRIVFDGRAATEPLIANLVETTGEKVNILSANTKSVGGVGFGQMIVELPKEEESANRVLEFLKDNKVKINEIIREGE